MRSYATARTLFGFLEFVFWSVAAIGVIGALAGAVGASRGFGGGGALVGALPGLVLALLGLFGVAMIQNARAGVDSAEYSQQMLKIARDQLEVSKQTTRGQQATTASFSTSNTAPDKNGSTNAAPQIAQSSATATPSQASSQHPVEVRTDTIHRNHRILYSANGYLVDGQTFATIEGAREHIDMMLELERD